jgi:hypothetical protein
MIGVLVTFAPAERFDPGRLAQIAEGSRETFEGMPGLRSKAFAVDEDGRRARNFYLWEDEASARSFFDDELVERVTRLYGVEPTVEYLNVVGLIDNAS